MRLLSFTVLMLTNLSFVNTLRPTAAFLALFSIFAAPAFSQEASGKKVAPRPASASPAEKPSANADFDKTLTTNHGIPISDNQNSLKAGLRGPTLLEDFVLREKITHFDHERIPERIVHARGTGAHGHFQAYKSQSDITKAAFLQNPEAKTEVFVRSRPLLADRARATRRATFAVSR